MSPAQLTPVTLAQSHTLQTSSTQQQGTVQHAYIPGNWNYRGYCKYHNQSRAVCFDASVLCDYQSKSYIPVLPASEIQMMTLPHAQYVIAEASTPVSGVSSNQVKTVSEFDIC